jgi:hypothetical protein
MLAYLSPNGPKQAAKRVVQSYHGKRAETNPIVAITDAVAG